MKGFGIYVKNDLLDPKHVRNMGPAVWLYMWYLDKITAINDNEIGKVLGGQPIIFEMVKAELGISRRTYVRWVEMLLVAGYINTLRTPTGLVVTVSKANKPFKKKGSAKSGTSYQDRSDETKTAHQQSDAPQMVEGSAKSAHPNKTIQDNTSITTVTNVTVGADAQSGKDMRNKDIQELVDKFQSAMELTMARPQFQRRAARTLITRWTLPVVMRACDAVAACRDDRYSPKITSLEDLRDRWNDLIAYYRRNGAMRQSKGVVID